MNSKLCITTTIRATKRELKEFVNYHLNIGIDHIFLFFDNPNDENISLFIVNEQVTTTVCTTAHWVSLGCSFDSDIEIRQKANVNYAIELALSLDMNWISHIDIDELIYPVLSIKTIINKAPEDISYIWLRPSEAIPEKEYLSVFQEVNLFKVLSESRMKVLIGNEEESTLANILYLKQFFRGHMGGKSIVKISAKIKKNIKCLGIHKPTFYNTHAVQSIENKDIFLLHYDCCTFENWLVKWERRYDGSATFNGRINRKTQYNEFVKAYESSSDKLLELYKRYYHLTNQEVGLLEKYALIKKINIPKEYFRSP